VFALFPDSKCAPRGPVKGSDEGSSLPGSTLDDALHLLISIIIISHEPFFASGFSPFVKFESTQSVYLGNE
jgi:hypothetical protein